MLRIPRLGGTLLGVLVLALPAPTADPPASSGIKVDKDKRTVTIDCKVAPRKMDDPRYQKPDGLPYPIEVIACWPFPKGQKAHETVITFDVKPSEVHKALEELGLKPGTPSGGQEEPKGPEVNIYLDLPRTGGEFRRVPIEKTIVDRETGKPMPKFHWRFTGSVMTKPDPTKDETVYGADLTGTLICVIPVTNQTVFQTSLTLKDEKYIRPETDPKVLPAIGSPVKLVIEVPKGK
jgi:hypothetical protein